MLERDIYDRYRIYPDEITNIGDDYLIFSEGEVYLIRPIDQGIRGRLQEKVAMAEWLQYYGEKDVCTFIKNKEGKRQLLPVDGKETVVMQIPKLSYREFPSYKGSIGRRLAQFHQKGVSYSNQKKERKEFVPWKERWERRLDQLENWYIHIVREKKKNKFDEEFCITYPYFMGLTENAIQLMTDVYFDVPQASINPYHTICHLRFQESSWLTVEEGAPSRIKVPTDFIYDHFTRDLGEYVRHLWVNYGWTEECKKEITTFLNDYESMYKLSTAEQIQLMARLMFPSHYFDSVEKYYQTYDNKDKEQCLAYFKQTEKYEELILFVAERFRSRNQYLVVPEWLSGKRNKVASTASF
ncbi:spore coat protein YutH [Evansella vedderi]|uniref:Spore coat protein YutH n=1 Tax=Evansella vedderi TaxID=38282 RepID=A0ABU0A2C2_9BACI|nr:spore coat protein YutH [Evansella vedderi]MDQ0257640.1 spore coat protein YutH [Evansella vedderi]